MKNLILFFIFIATVFSCDFNDQPEPKESVLKWVIAGYQEGGVSNSSYTTVRDSSYVYFLSSNGTFRKTIGKKVITGSYSERFEDGLKKYLFEYESADAALIHSCNNDKEEYFLNSQGQLTGTWDACNGTKLYFNKQ
ncbi:hypothetical protein LV84_01507 [Algoriphagus ratkowskyi]|uniref:Lipocalin-like protein n=1 Tax=Algoriphagus ratkowskyi TaxID=57028 RepID=A0A2W7RBE4_9BACT|nr:hypothetical protein [Algoriphagus ratkowskyi]PZX58303.1 hypothetical protein LV84_01507 [Algoriphagus ratkowskyi]TXD77822.1 hypothetical protein ESW18_10680 [Algoriphagus ratkowskyi]